MTQVSPVESATVEAPTVPHRVGSDRPFYICFGVIGGFYVLLIVLMLAADAWRVVYDPNIATWTSPRAVFAALAAPEIQYAIWLSMISCTLTTIFSLWVATPIGYLMSRHEFRGKVIVDAILDIPIVLPPLVLGLSLLILFQFAPFRWISDYVVYEVPSVILAQFMVACAFAVRTMRTTFDQISPRQEQVALTLGCSQSQAFFAVVLPQARRGAMTAATLAWARSLGEFGPILIFAGSTRMRTEVLPTTVFLEMQAGNLTGALAVSLLMVVAAVIVLVLARLFGLRKAVVR